MAFVYRYLHPKSGQVAYIGKTSGNSIDSLKGRISAHAHESKFIKGAPRSGWKIEFVDGLSPADADILETALIADNAHVPELNKGKTNWGNTRFVDVSGLSWKSWPPGSLNEQKPIIDRWYGGPPECWYRCECCGAKQQTGKKLMPSHIYLSIRYKKAMHSGGIWLCDNCAENAGKVVEDYIDKLRHLKEASNL